MGVSAHSLEAFPGGGQSVGGQKHGNWNRGGV